MVQSVNLLIAVTAFGAASIVAAPLTARFEPSTPQVRDIAELELEAREFENLEARRRRRPSVNSINNAIEGAQVAVPLLGAVIGKPPAPKREFDDEIEARFFEELETRRRRGGSRRPSLNTVNNVIEGAGAAVPVLGALIGKPPQQRDFNDELEARDFVELEFREFEDLQARKKTKKPSSSSSSSSGASKPNKPASSPSKPPANKPAQPAKPPASKPNQPAKPPASKPNQPAKPPASKPNQPAKPPASKPNQPAKPPASKPNQPAKPPASKPNQPAQPPASKPNQPAKPPASKPNKPANRPKKDDRPHSSTTEKVDTAINGVGTLIDGIQTIQQLTQPAPPAESQVPAEAAPPPAARSFDDWAELDARDLDYSMFDELD